MNKILPILAAAVLLAGCGDTSAYVDTSNSPDGTFTSTTSTTSGEITFFATKTYTDNGSGTSSGSVSVNIQNNSTINSYSFTYQIQVWNNGNPTDVSANITVQNLYPGQVATGSTMNCPSLTSFSDVKIIVTNLNKTTPLGNG